MAKQKVLKNGKVFACYLEKDHIDHIKKMAAKMSIAEGRDISASEATRMALEEVYPMQQYKQLDFAKKPLKAQKNKNSDDRQLSML